jgi:histidine ammonia-lyase
MIKLSGEMLSLKEVERVSEGEEVSLSDDVPHKVEKSARFIEEIASQGKVVYGVTTGFGKLCDTVIPPDEVSKLQENLLMSHASGMGDPMLEKNVRAGIVVRINSLARGYSGVRLETLEKLVEILNKHIYPYVPMYGSVGASGDLAPLAHISLLIIGRGKVIHNGVVRDFSEVMGDYQFVPLKSLKAKEGLALINGTAVEAGIAALLVRKAFYLFDLSLKAAAMSFEALRGRREAFDRRIQELRGIPEQIEVADFVLKEVEGSKLINSVPRVQDAYSLRCIPSVYGAILSALRYVEDTILREINAVTDNPLVFADDGDVLSGGNFHAEPVALVMDHFAVALSEIASISERRMNRLLNPALSELPAFLVKHSGLNSGMMIVQYTAASLVSENKALAHPASVDSIPVSADQEDHVSMGMNAVIKSEKVLKNLQWVVASELLVAAQAVDFYGKENLGKGTRSVYEVIRSKVPFAEKDREFSYDLKAIFDLLESRSI